MRKCLDYHHFKIVAIHIDFFKSIAKESQKRNTEPDDSYHSAPVSTNNQGTGSPLPSTRSSSSLFDADSPLDLSQTSQHADNHPVHSEPPADLQETW